jgi:type IV pilus assembly protein PilA
MSMMSKKHRSSGFSLIELLVVVAIILIIVAIALPNLTRSKIAANQASAINSLRTINSAEAVYVSTYGIGYSATLGALGPASAQPTSSNADLIDEVLAGGTGSSANSSAKSGYTFTYAPSAAVDGQISSFSLKAAPQQLDITGRSGYYTDQTYVIRFDTSGTATSASTPIGG